MFRDKNALAKFKELMTYWKFNNIVETGTWLGESTLEFSNHCNYVFTIEVNRAYAQRASESFVENGFHIEDMNEDYGFIMIIHRKGDKKIFLILGQSENIIPKLYEYKFLSNKDLFFLDAHWDGHYPLPDEISAIQGKENYIIIHDMKVPGKDFGYDKYDNGLEITPEYVLPFIQKLNPNYHIFYNEKVCEGVEGRGIMFCEP